MSEHIKRPERIAMTLVSLERPDTDDVPARATSFVRGNVRRCDSRRHDLELVEIKSLHVPQLGLGVAMDDDASNPAIQPAVERTKFPASLPAKRLAQNDT